MIRKTRKMAAKLTAAAMALILLAGCRTAQISGQTEPAGTENVTENVTAQTEMSGAEMSESGGQLSGAAEEESVSETAETAVGSGGTAGEEVASVTGEGRFAGGEEELTQEQQEFILSFMDFYYQSLATLTPADPSGYFAPEAYTQAVGNEIVWDYQIELRAIQQTDLSLTHYSYELTVDSVEYQADGSLEIWIDEYSIQNFTAYPGVDSECGSIYHHFVLEDTQDGPKLLEHVQWDSLYWQVMLPYFWEAAPSPEAARQVFTERKDELIAQAENHLAMKAVQGQEGQAVQADHPYDREAAAAYALTWALDRNEDEWLDYSRSGGNCQNFVSQCLLAGGIPMDTTGGAVWKWYGRTPNNSASASGRSASWTGVQGFLSYVRNNEGGAGMAATADAPFYEGQVGDVIHMAYDDEDWRHAVIITDVMTDEEGNVVDYLICSNTADQRNFPVSAYVYTRQILIQIHGWND